MGRSILASLANRLLTQHVWIRHIADPLILSKLKDNETILRRYETINHPWFKNFFSKVINHYADYRDAYVFHKDEVIKCFEHANYLMILGATQYKDDDPYKEGMPTAIIAGCMPVGDTFETVDKDPLGYEHPPKIYKPQVPQLDALKNKLTELLNKMEVKDADISQLKKELNDLLNSDDVANAPDKIVLIEEKL